MNRPTDTVLVALILSAPWALVLLVAFVRGYNVHVTFQRRGRPGGDDDAD